MLQVASASLIDGRPPEAVRKATSHIFLGHTERPRGSRSSLHTTSCSIHGHVMTLSSIFPFFRIDLGAVFALTYDRGRYVRSIDYTAEPHPALAEEDRAWAAETARAAVTPPPTH